MKIKQDVYFGIGSDACDPDAITAAVGLSPDRVIWRGSSSTQPFVRPASNHWALYAKGSGSVDDRIEELLDRLDPHVERILQLVASSDVTLTIEVVRYFNDPAGEEENLDSVVTESGRTLEKLSGQHQLLGFGLSVDTMRRLVALGCYVDFDEYG